MDSQGVLLCAKYAVSPNFFGYCGPRKSASVIDHLKEKIVDEELVEILSDFETLYPYLQLIARQNKISSPFDQRVVEAYWLGNSLLKPLTGVEYFAFSKERLNLDRKLSKPSFQKLLIKMSKQPFLPHHAFHVFNVFKRSGKDFGFQVLETMDNCRIGWGRVREVQGSRFRVQGCFVETKPLIKTDAHLALSQQPILREVKVDYMGKSFVKDLKPGDWVSFHWGYLCEVLTKGQVRLLEFYTKKAIEFFNLAI